jgi:phage shock protein E
MHWTPLLILLAIVVAFTLVKRLSQISAKTARSYLQQGALVVDVRTNAEFQAHHLPHALHVPLNELEQLIARRVKDKNQVLLLHCQSGTRSQVARRRLVQLGYTHAYNLGSYARAERIVGAR